MGKTISQMTQLIANAKVSATGTGSAAMKKLMSTSTQRSSPSSSASYAEPAKEAITTNDESHQRLEKRFTNLKSSLVDKYHSSKQ